MKSNFLTLGLMVLLPACTQAQKPQTNIAPVTQVRLSDRYSHDKVKSYEVFEAGMEDHIIMLVRLSTGEHYPMVCRKTSSGIYPIPQSVFADPKAEQWSIMCEPHYRNTHALMRLELSSVDGALLMRDTKLKPAEKARLLARPTS